MSTWRARLGWTTAGAVAALCLIGAGARAQDAPSPDLPIGTLMGEGDTIAKQQQTVTTTLQKVSEDEGQAGKDKTGLGQDSQGLATTAQDFNTRCNHPFYTGQEAQVAACQAEQQQDLLAIQRFIVKQAAFKARVEAIKLRRQEAEMEKARLANLADAWKHKMNALAVTDVMKACLKAQPPLAADADMEAVVLDYQHCWDKR